MDDDDIGPGSLIVPTKKFYEDREREKVAQWMVANGFATGHGDTIEALLGELKYQIDGIRAAQLPKGTIAVFDGDLVPAGWALLEALHVYDKVVRVRCQKSN